METTNAIRIPAPSAEMLAVLSQAHQQKKMRMKRMREKIDKQVK